MQRHEKIAKFCAVHQHASHLLFHPDKVFTGHVVIPDTADKPSTDRLLWGKRAKQGWMDRSGEDCLARTDLYILETR